MWAALYDLLFQSIHDEDLWWGWETFRRSAIWRRDDWNRGMRQMALDTTAMWLNAMTPTQQCIIAGMKAGQRSISRWNGGRTEAGGYSDLIRATPLMSLNLNLSIDIMYVCADPLFQVGATTRTNLCWVMEEGASYNWNLRPIITN